MPQSSSYQKIALVVVCCLLLTALALTDRILLSYHHIWIAAALLLALWLMCPVMVRLINTTASLRTLFDHVSSGIVTLNTAGEIDSANPAALRIFGLESSALAGKVLMDLFPEIAPHFANFQACRQRHEAFSEGIFPLDLCLRRHDGHLVFLEVSLCNFPLNRRVSCIAILRDVTWRRKSQEALRSSEERFRTFVTSMDDLLFILDREQKHVAVYGRWLERQNLNPEQFIGRTASEIFAGTSMAELHHQYNARALQGEHLVYEWAVDWNGRVHHYQTALSPMFNASGGITGVVGVGRDITSLKEAEQSLRNSEARFRAIFEHAAIGISMSSADGQILAVNAAALRYGCYSEAELLQRRWMDVSHPNDIAEDLKLHRKMIAGEITHYQIEKRYVRKNGSVAWGRLTSSVVRESANEVKLVIRMLEEITEQKQAMAELERREQEFRALVERAPDIICRFDQDCRFLYANPALANAFNMTQEVLLGKTHAELGLPGSVTIRTQRSVTKVFETAEEDLFEFSVERGKDRRFFQSRMVPEQDKQGNVTAVLSIARDISAKKEAEDILREANARISAMTSHVPGMVFQMGLAESSGAISFDYVSHGSLGVCGLQPRQLRASPDVFVQLLHPEDRESFWKNLHGSAQSLIPWNWEGRLLGEQIGEKWINVRAKPKRVGDDQTIWDGMIIDISRSKQYERDLKSTGQRLRDLSSRIEAVREEERTRIAREIHDELGQLLTGLKMGVARLGLKYGNEHPELQDEVVAIKALADRSMQVVRGIAAELRPRALDLGIVGALEWLTQEFRERMGLPCDLRVPGEEISTNQLVTIAIFRLVQESLTNIVRHANASMAEISLEVVQEQLLLSISDDGCGFDVSRCPDMTTFGLFGMQERVRTLGGDMTIDSTLLQGTHVQIVLPMTIEH